MMLSRDLLRELLAYDPKSGLFSWVVSGRGRYSDLVAGTPNRQGQILICVNYRRYLAHRLAWLYVHGEPVPKEIDHINGDCSDNRIANLRATTHSQNLVNSKTRSDNTSGERGVCWDKQKGKWKVQVGPAGNRVQRHFKDYNDAVSFAQATRREIFGVYAR